MDQLSQGTVQTITDPDAYIDNNTVYVDVTLYRSDIPYVLFWQKPFIIYSAFVYKGYFPLFKQDVDASSYSKGNGGSKIITISDVSYYMPTGLSANQEFNGISGSNPFVYQTALAVGYDPRRIVYIF